MTWDRPTSYSWRCSPWTVCGVRMNGRAVFELWHDKRPDCVGGEFKTADAARKEAERIEMAGQG